MDDDETADPAEEEGEYGGDETGAEGQVEPEEAAVSVPVEDPVEDWTIGDVDDTYYEYEPEAYYYNVKEYDWGEYGDYGVDNDDEEEDYKPEQCAIVKPYFSEEFARIVPLCRNSPTQEKALDRCRDLIRVDDFCDDLPAVRYLPTISAIVATVAFVVMYIIIRGRGRYARWRKGR